MQRDINSSLAMFGLFFIAIHLGVVGLHKFHSLISWFVVAVRHAVILTGKHFASVHKSCCSHLGSMYAVKTHAINN